LQYPIITRITEPQTVTLGGETFVAAETVIMDYGPRQGVTRSYIRAPEPDPEAEIRERANMNRFLAGYGLRLKERAGG